MLRDILNRVGPEKLKLFIDATSKGHYDFSHPRIGLAFGACFCALLSIYVYTNFIVSL